MWIGIGSVVTIVLFFILVFMDHEGEDNIMVIKLFMMIVYSFLVLSLLYVLIDDKLKESCEKTLPRDQQCVIIAVPKEEKTND